MDFLDPKKRKSNQRRLFLGYGLMAILIAMVSGLLLLQAYGWTYNPRTGNIAQNGLLFVDSSPLQAEMFLNGESKGLTDKRLVLSEGKYDISLQREGYHNWETSVVIRGGTIERFLYPFLFPAEINTTEVELFATQPQFITQSPDRQWLVTSLPGTIGSFVVLNLNEENPTPERFTLPETVFTQTGETHTVKLVEWSTNNNHFVIRHQFDGGEEYILLNREEPALSVNISNVINVPFTSLKLRDKKIDSYYLFNQPAQTLTQFDLEPATATPLLENVIAFHPHGDDELLYITDNGRPESETVELRMRESGNTYIISEIERADSYMLELASYEGSWYLVAAPTSEEKVYVFHDPIELLNNDKKVVPEAVLRVKNIKKVSFSQNARIIAAEGDSRIGIYDAEKKATTHYDSNLSLAKGTTLSWMDGHRLTAIAEDGTQHVFDFDGKNRQTLGKGYKTTMPYFDRDYTAVYTIGASTAVEDRAALLKTDLLLEEN